MGSDLARRGDPPKRREWRRRRETDSKRNKKRSDREMVSEEGRPERGEGRGLDTAWRVNMTRNLLIFYEPTAEKV